MMYRKRGGETRSGNSPDPHPRAEESEQRARKKFVMIIIIVTAGGRRRGIGRNRSEGKAHESGCVTEQRIKSGMRL